jgi:hypothetical protein
MLNTDPAFRPIRRSDGYLPLEDLSLIGDGSTCALVGLDGAIQWMCVPHFDSEPLFCGLLDCSRGGHFTVAPDEMIEARQRYEPDTAVLITELRCVTGVVQITDALALRGGAEIADEVAADRAELVRSALVLEGRVRLRVEVEPRRGGDASVALGGLQIRAAGRPDLQLHLRSNRQLEGLRGVHDLQGERLDLVLSWGRSRRHHALDAEGMLRATADSWRRWMRGFSYTGPQEPLVRRAAVTLKLLDSWVYGSALAAATSSLPAPIGGVRNWDYRYTWIRDASFAVFALRRIGFIEEADGFLGWVLDAFERVGSPRVRIMYTLDGRLVPDEWEDPELEGYRRSAPARWGNGAADQRQHDLYGEILDCADQWSRSGGPVEPHLWEGLASLAEAPEPGSRPGRYPGRGERPGALPGGGYGRRPGNLGRSAGGRRGAQDHDGGRSAHDASARDRREAGVEVTIDDFDRIHRRVPVLANVKTTGRYPVEYFWYAGGVPAVMLELRDLLHLAGRLFPRSEGRAWREHSGGRRAPRMMRTDSAVEGGVRLYGHVTPRGRVAAVASVGTWCYRHPAWTPARSCRRPVGAARRRYRAT